MSALAKEESRVLSGGAVVTQTLRALGADTMFSVSGNQVLPVFDAAADSGLRLIHMRSESSAAYAAGASAELTGRPGVLLVTAGPGFLAAMLGVAAVKAMELPLVFLSGATATPDAGAGGFQDLDQHEIARLTCKAAMDVRSVDQLQGMLIDAWRLAEAGVPGPVHVNLPSDVLVASCAPIARAIAPRVRELHARDDTTLAAMAVRLRAAARPVVIARPSAARGAAGDALRTLARKLGVTPVIVESPRGMSDPKFRDIAGQYRETDCALVVAPADFAVGFLGESVMSKAAAILLVDAPGDPPSRRTPDLHSQLAPDIALSALAELTADHQRAQPSASPPADATFESSAERLHPLAVAGIVRSLIEPDDIIILDGGEFCQWIRVGLADLPNRMLVNGKLGAIGGSIPMALGVAATGHAGRTIAFVGDGSFGYCASEFETAVRYALPFVVVVGNDARWSAEWFMQVSRYGPDRTFETDLSPARYDLVAEGLGAVGFHVADEAALWRTFEASLLSGRPACLNVQTLSVRSPAVLE